MAISLLVAACGGDDDDSASGDTSTTAPADETDDTTDDATDDTTDDSEDELDVCALLDIESINSITGETFTTADQTESDTCQLTDDAETTLLQLSVKVLEAGETEQGFVDDGKTACDDGTEVEVDTSYAAAGWACEVSGEAALMVAADGAGALLIGHPSDASLTTPQIVVVLNQIIEQIITG